jgi:hypothetical protein
MVATVNHNLKTANSTMIIIAGAKERLHEFVTGKAIVNTIVLKLLSECRFVFLDHFKDSFNLMRILYIVGVEHEYNLANSLAFIVSLFLAKSFGNDIVLFFGGAFLLGNAGLGLGVASFLFSCNHWTQSR